tara:strand:- start:104 stop:739 length:636 start_codon:yes stop_codon:yes gene_type:complete
MKKTLVPFGGYPVFKIESGTSINDQEYKHLKKTKLKTIRCGLKISENKNILTRKPLKRLKNLMWQWFEKYVTEILEIRNVFSFCQSWCTFQEKGSSHTNHSHHNNIFSGVYYAKTKGTKLNFWLHKSKLQESFYLSYPIIKENIFNSRLLTMDLKEGDVVFFPGDLMHESVESTDDERLIVGASFFIDGKLGSDDESNAIDIVNNKNKGYF